MPFWGARFSPSVMPLVENAMRAGFQRLARGLREQVPTSAK